MVEAGGQRVSALGEILDRLRRWGIKWSLWPVHLVTACCGVEMAHTWAPMYDAERLGSLPWQTPRQCNVILVEGTITFKMARVLRLVWEQMSDPKYVIAMGACAVDGGIFWNSYHVVPVGRVVPIDAYAVGCPPTPEAVIQMIRMVQEKVEKGYTRPSIRPKTIDLTKILPPAPAKQPLPPSPIRISPTPKLAICVEKPVNWPFGKGLVDNVLKPGLEGIAHKIAITDVNRICVEVPPESIKDAARRLKDIGFDHVKSINVIDVPHEGKFYVEYWVSSYSKREYMSILIALTTVIPRDNPKLPSLIDIWPNADYMEREMYDFYGIWFEGNPGMGRNFLLDPDTPIKFPLRKDVPVVPGYHLVERSFPKAPPS